MMVGIDVLRSALNKLLDHAKDAEADSIDVDAE